MSVIAAGRDAVDRLLLLDTCTIASQATTYVDGSLTDDPTVTIYTGGCRVKPASDETLQIADGQFDAYAYTVTVPHDVDGVKPGDIITVTATTDGDLNGAVLVVTGVPRRSTFSILRRLACRLIESDQA
jgi:hypothetical protein